MDDSYSSGGSVIRVPVKGGGDEEDGYSSDGSVIRVPIPNVDGQGEEDGYSSDASVVRVPISANTDIANGVTRGHRRENDCLGVGSYPEANGGKGKGHPCNEEGLEEKGEVACGPSKAMNMNLMAAARYFATSAGKTSQDSGAGVAGKQPPSMGIEQVSRREQDNPQVLLTNKRHRSTRCVFKNRNFTNRCESNNVKLIDLPQYWHNVLLKIFAFY